MMLKWIKSRKDACMRWAGKWYMRDGVQKEHTFGSKTIDGRSSRSGITIAAQVICAKRIDRDQNDIRTTLLRCCRYAQKEKHCKAQDPFHFPSIQSLIFIAFVFTFSASTADATSWTVEGFFGVAHSFSSEVHIETSTNDLRFSADYDSKSFDGPLYYALRAGRWADSRGWEVEFVHLKIFVTNPPAEVQRFSISHGYNLLMLNRGWRLDDFVLRAGGGVVVAHPETVIGGITSEQGYKWTGPCGQIALGRRLYFSRNVFASVEGKFTIARAKVSIGNGTASVPNVSLHGLFGLGFDFR